MNCKVIKFVDRHIQKDSHLVDKSAGPAGTTTVHSHVGPEMIVKKYYL